MGSKFQNIIYSKYLIYLVENCVKQKLMCEYVCKYTKMIFRNTYKSKTCIKLKARER